MIKIDFIKFMNLSVFIFQTFHYLENKWQEEYNKAKL